jgi:hypothetical protein
VVIGRPSEGHQPGCAPDEGGNQWSSEGHQRVISLDAHRDAALHHAVVAVGRARTRGVALVHGHPRLDSQAPVLVVPDEGGTHWPSGGHSLTIRGVLTGHQGGTHWPSGGYSLAIRGALTGHQGGTHWPSGGHQRPSTVINGNQGAINGNQGAIKDHQGAINGNQGGHQRPLSAIEANQRTRCRPTAPAARGSSRIGSHSNNSLGRSRRILRGSPQASRARHHLQLPTSAGR